MAYRIVRTETADEQMHHIILGIAEKFGAATALDQLAEMETEIMRLAESPQIGVIPRYPALRRMGYRVLILSKDLVFYKINETAQTVVVYAVVDQRQDYIHILQGL